MTARVVRAFTIPGAPVPHPRATGMEFKRGSKRTKAYLDYKTFVGWAFRFHYPTAEPFTGPVCLTVVFQHPDPWSRSARRYDWSNCVKAIEDGLNHIAYLDDWQVGNHKRTVEYGPEPCAVVTITGMEATA